MTTAVTTAPTRVLLVDDDPWTRGGAAAALSADAHLRVEACSVADALDGELPLGIDALVIDVVQRMGADRYRGVKVVEAVRRADEQSGRRRTIVVLTAAPADEILVVRVAEAGADVLWCWHEVGEADLLGAVRGGVARSALDVVALKARSGLDPAGRVNGFVDQLLEQGLVAAFAPGTTQQGSGLARRRSMAVRRLAGEVAGLRTSATVGTTTLQTPSWREVRRFVQRALGLALDEPDVGGELPLSR